MEDDNKKEKISLENLPEKINTPKLVIENTPKRKDSRLVPLEAKRGKTAVIYLKIAQMAVRGFSVEQIADEVKVPTARVSKLLRANNQVWDYISRAIQETFSEGDRILAYLYKKSMMSLDDELSSSQADIRQKARAQIFDMLKAMQMTRAAGEEGVQDNRSVVFNQFFGGKQSSSSKIKSMDDLILQKRIERGLETEMEESVEPEAELIDEELEDDEEEPEDEDAINESQMENTAVVLRAEGLQSSDRKTSKT